LQEAAEHPYARLAPEVLPLAPESAFTSREKEEGLEVMPPEAEDVSVPEIEGLEVMPPEAEDVHWYDEKKKTIDPKAYDTKLAPEQEAQYQEWKARVKPAATEEDYDLRGAWNESIQPDENGLLPDKYTKPNNPRFTVNSKYATGADKPLADRWDEEGNFIEPSEPKPGYFTEAGARFGKEFMTASRQAGRMLYGTIQSMTDSGRNPYVWASEDDAKADIPGLEEQLAAQKDHLADLGTRKEYPAGLDPQQKIARASAILNEADELRNGIERTQTQLDWAKEASVGRATQGLVGTVSENAERQEQAIKNAQRQSEKWWGQYITEARNSDEFQQLAGGLGATLPTVGATALATAATSGGATAGLAVRTLFGLGSIYFQIGGAAMDEFEERSKRLGIPLDTKRQMEYAHAQAAANTPPELAGEFLLGGKIGKILGKAPAKFFKDKNAAGEFLKEGVTDLIQELAGEVGLTTPIQHFAEQAVGQAFGVKDPQTMWEQIKSLPADMKMAAYQTLVVGGTPFLAAATYHSANGDFKKADAAFARAEALGELVKARNIAGLTGAAEAVPALGREIAGEKAQVLQQAAAAVPEWERAQRLQQAAEAAPALAQGQAAQNAALLRQAAAQAPALLPQEQQQPALLQAAAAAAAPEAQQAAAQRNQELLSQAAEQAPGLAPQIELPVGSQGMALPEERMPPPVSTGAAVVAAESRINNINAQLATNADPARAVELQKEKAILENKVQSARDVALAKQTSAKVEAAGAPATAKALEASTETYIDERDQALHEAVDESSDLFAEEEGVPPAGPRRGEAGFASPAGEVVGAKAPAIPPNEDEALTAAEQRAKAGDIMGAKNALNRVGFFNEDIKPPDNWDGTAAEWEEQRAQNAAINREIARRRKNVEMQLPSTEEAAAPAAPEAASEEVVIRPGIKGQEAVVTRPSAQMRTELAGTQVDVEVISTNGEKRIQKQDAAQALSELSRDKTGFQLLADCIK
jgi:hypothetical protein